MKPSTSIPRRPAPLAAAALLALALVPGCNEERKGECDRLIAAMKPLAEGTPSAEAVDRVHGDVSAMKFKTQPLEVYARNYLSTLEVLSGTLRLKAGPAPPDGTDEVVKAKLKEARTDAADTARYCAQ